MSEMLDFNVQMLGKLADWLLSEPIVYFVGMVLMCFVMVIISRPVVHGALFLMYTMEL